MYGRALSVVSPSEQISHLACAGNLGVREHRPKLGYSITRSTISRELPCNAATRSRGVVYRAHAAQWHAKPGVLSRTQGPAARFQRRIGCHPYPLQDRLGGMIARPLRQSRVPGYPRCAGDLAP